MDRVFLFKSVFGIIPVWSKLVQESLIFDFSFDPSIEKLFERVIPVWKNSSILFGRETQGVKEIVLEAGAFRSPPLNPDSDLGESN